MTTRRGLLALGCKAQSCTQLGALVTKQSLWAAESRISMKSLTNVLFVRRNKMRGGGIGLLVQFQHSIVLLRTKVILNMVCMINYAM